MYFLIRSLLIGIFLETSCQLHIFHVKNYNFAEVGARIKWIRCSLFVTKKKMNAELSILLLLNTACPFHSDTFLSKMRIFRVENVKLAACFWKNTNRCWKMKMHRNMLPIWSILHLEFEKLYSILPRRCQNQMGTLYLLRGPDVLRLLTVPEKLFCSQFF